MSLPPLFREVPPELKSRTLNIDGALSWSPTRRLKRFSRGVYDVRPGEGVRTLFMALHLLFILFAYYILKPVSRALFLHKFDLDQLPYLYLLIAAAGGLLAYAYTLMAVRSSLQAATGWTMMLSVLCLVSIWWLLGFNFDWMRYVFNVWVSLFSIVLVSQGWFAAANVSTAAALPSSTNLPNSTN
jgi:hypothetical protein